jgi:hypothetical protein
MRCLNLEHQSDVIIYDSNMFIILAIGVYSCTRLLGVWGIYYKTSHIGNVQKMDRLHIKLVFLLLSETFIAFDKRTSLL